MRKIKTPDSGLIGVLAGGALVGATVVFLPWQFTIIACMIVGIMALASLLSKLSHAGAGEHIANVLEEDRRKSS
jgi:hypothetical protein